MHRLVYGAVLVLALLDTLIKLFLAGWRLGLVGHVRALWDVSVSSLLIEFTVAMRALNEVSIALAGDLVGECAYLTLHHGVVFDIRSTFKLLNLLTQSDSLNKLLTLLLPFRLLIAASFLLFDLM